MVNKKRAKSKKPLKRKTSKITTKKTQKKRKKPYDPYKTYESGGRVEAYTFGEAQSSKSWP